MIHYFLVKDIADEKEFLKLTAQLTGPLLTDARRIKKQKERAPDEPPMPYWWDDDDVETSTANITAARQLGIA